MKTLTIVLFVFIFALLAVIFVGVTELNDLNRLKQSTIDGLNKRIKEQKDSLEKQLSLTRDSLDIAFETIKIATKEREEAHLRTQKTIKDLQRIVFIQHTDSSRLAILKSLYKSYE